MATEFLLLAAAASALGSIWAQCPRISLQLPHSLSLLFSSQGISTPLSDPRLYTSLLSSSLLCFVFLGKDPGWELFLRLFVTYFSTPSLYFQPGRSLLNVYLLHKMGIPVYLLFLFLLFQGSILIVESKGGILWETEEATWESQKIQKRMSYRCPAEDVWWAAYDPGNSLFPHHLSFALNGSFHDVIMYRQMYEYQFWASQVFWHPEVFGFFHPIVFQASFSCPSYLWSFSQ